MPRLVDFLKEHRAFKEAAKAGARGWGRIVAPTFTHSYLAGGVIAEQAPDAAWLVVAAHEDAAEELHRELSLFLPGRTVYHLPARGVWYGSEAGVPPRVAGRRARALAALGEPGSIVVIEAATLLEAAVPSAKGAFKVSVGARAGFDDLIMNLVELCYERVDQVEEAGEFSVRGGLIDVFPTTEQAPVRMEFWGDEVESIRSFSVYSQRSLATRDLVDVHPAAEAEETEPVPITQLLPAGIRVLSVDPAGALPRVQAFQADIADVFGDTSRHAGYVTWESVDERLAALPRFLVEGLAEHAREPGLSAPPDAPLVRATSGDLPITSLPEAERVLENLKDEGYRVVVAFEQRAEAQRAGYILKGVTGLVAEPQEIREQPGITYMAAAHRRHFIIPEIRLALLTEVQIFPKRRKATGERRLVVGAEISTFRDLRSGDYVVHQDHGIGRFVGLSTKTVAGITRDYLDIAFRDGDMLYIPHDQIAKVSRYVGADGAPPALSKLGGKAWEQSKNRVRRAVREMAGELLQLYALRQTTEGYAFSEDGEWQRRFELAFPHEETSDQLRAIDAVKDDMEAVSPMDRLICGDVGYGKTEVALRAAFKAIMDGKQVMMLVPTTILAQQHYGTFRERMAAFPVRVEMISRFRGSREQRRILRDFSEGKIDVLLGTHRLLSQDVRPKDLGLVIVDEEQRFGVNQKENLRRLKLRVDVLTLSATPIPRTLQMSFSGVRDISAIDTPPRDRHPIQTYVGLYDEGMVMRAIQREVDRGGQVFFLHNRVETIDRAAERLRVLLPHLRFGIAHGQMPEQALERVMVDFLRGDYDVLVSTTIIESGLDIPNANTLIVERADLLGLAQLYQIRGRIGRSHRVAHAFLFHPDEAILTEEARARLSTLADYTELGSGFKIALRDLEIRGAGNLLGEEQSGHMAAVGFEMYLSMLRETVEALQGREAAAERIPRVDIGISAYIPSSFIPYEAAKVDLHRRIAGATRAEEFQGLREELRDRFGDVPKPVDSLIFLGEVRGILQSLKAEAITAHQQRVTVAGLFLPKGGREALRARDRRYVYAPATGTLSISFRGETAGTRETAERVLGDILHVWSAQVEGAA